MRAEGVGGGEGRGIRGVRWGRTIRWVTETAARGSVPAGVGASRRGGGYNAASEGGLVLV